MYSRLIRRCIYIYIYNQNGSKQSIDKFLQGEYGSSRWYPALSNECGRLAQGNNAGVQHTDTIKFISHTHIQVPTEKKTIYASFVTIYH